MSLYSLSHFTKTRTTLNFPNHFPLIIFVKTRHLIKFLELTLAHFTSLTWRTHDFTKIIALVIRNHWPPLLKSWLTNHSTNTYLTITLVSWLWLVVAHLKLSLPTNSPTIVSFTDNISIHYIRIIWSSLYLTCLNWAHSFIVWLALIINTYNYDLNKMPTY